MKKAKTVLTAIAVLAVIGGALAFKARSFTQHQFYRTTHPFGFCTITTSPSLTTVPQPGQTGLGQTTYFTAPVLGRPCPATTVYTVL